MHSSPRFHRRTFCLGALSLSASGCTRAGAGTTSNAPDSPEEGPGAYRGPLVDPKKIPGDFLWQQRVTAWHGEKKGAFDAVVQKKGAELLVLGLTPMNTRGFALTQTGTEFEYEQFVPFELPFSPASVLYDIHRAFFYNLLQPFPQSEVRESTFEEERIKDEFSGGRLLRRVFAQVSGTTESLTIEYAPVGYARGIPPEVTNIDNQAYGYKLRVVTTSTRAL